MQSIHCAILVLLSCCCLASSVLAQTDFESALINYLKNNVSNYSPLLKPRLNPYSTIYITMDTVLAQIVSVETAKQSIKISAYMQAMWTEERLVWDPTKFGGIRVVNWDGSQIWYPVIVVYNGIGDNQVLTPQIPAFLNSLTPNSTSVTFAWRRDFEFSCVFNMANFPIDTHTCELEFFFSDQGHGNILVLPVKNTAWPMNPLALYRENSEWELLNLTTRAERKAYNLIQGAPGPMLLPAYVIRIVIKRVSTYYFMNVITPLLLLTLLQILVYFVPVESGEKLGFGITIMLSYTVFLLMLDGLLPKTSTSPAVASFITAAMILSTISLLLTSLIMRCHFTPDGTRMPACFHAIFVRFLGRLFCVRGAATDKVDDQASPPLSLPAESELNVKNLDENEASEPNKVREGQQHGAVRGAVRSDWILAAHAIERLMVALGVLATFVIIGIYIIKPYVTLGV